MRRFNHSTRESIRRETILLIEPDIKTRVSLKQRLIEESYHVIAPWSVMESLNALQEKQIDIVLMDHKAPLRVGFQKFLKVIKKTQKLVIALHGQTLKTREQLELTLLGVKSTFKKSDDMQQLLKAIDSNFHARQKKKLIESPDLFLSVNNIASICCTSAENVTSWIKDEGLITHNDNTHHRWVSLNNLTLFLQATDRDMPETLPRLQTLSII